MADWFTPSQGISRPCWPPCHNTLASAADVVHAVHTGLLPDPGRRAMPSLHCPSMPTPPLPSARPIDFLRHGLIVVGFNVLLSISMLHEQRQWLTQMVYTQAIGLSIWASIDFGRFAFRRDPLSGWPTGWRFRLLLGTGIVIGYAVGTTIGDWYCGCSFWTERVMTPRRAVSFLVMGLCVSAAITFFFVARGKDLRRQHEIAAAQRDASEAQLRLLASQLEPHMLFNTLANLRVLIAMDPPRAQQMLDRLIAFLRATLNASRATQHALSAEFERTADYLGLMQIRMGPRLRVQLHLPPELATQLVPSLLLQPLVENAIKHGLEPHVNGGTLTVTASRDGNTLVLQVHDTGMGLADPGAEPTGDDRALQGRAEAGSTFGLTHVRQRLDTLYGDAASLTLAPAASLPDVSSGASRAASPDVGPAAPNAGTLATLRLPLASATP